VRLALVGGAGRSSGWGQGVDDAAGAHLDALRPEAAGLLGGLVDGEAAVGPHDPPPGEAAAVLGQERTDAAGRARASGPTGHLPVGHDLPDREVRDDGPDALLQRRHAAGP
jgi:hypothetical protein